MRVSDVSNVPEVLPPNVRSVSIGKIVALATTVIITVGTVAVAYYNNRPDTSDRWYGKDGRANVVAISKNSERISALEQLFITTNLRLQAIEHNDRECNEKMDELFRWRKDHDEFRADSVIEFSLKLQSLERNDVYMEKMLDKCLKRTGMK